MAPRATDSQLTPKGLNGRCGRRRTVKQKAAVVRLQVLGEVPEIGDLLWLLKRAARIPSLGKSHQAMENHQL